MANKVALITGGASGIGLDVARALNDRSGWKVHVLARNEERIAQAREKHREISFHKADVRIYEDLAATFQTVFKEHGRLDFVFANAGLIERTNFYADQKNDGDNPPPKPDLTPIDVDLNGTVMTAYLALHYFRLSPQEGRTSNLIINSSCGGLYPAYYAPLYSAAKHGTVGFMRSVAQHFRLHGIRVNGICPGIVRTNLVDNESWKSFPSHRFIPVETVARVVLLLLDGDENKDKEIVDGNGHHIAPSRLYGLTVEISDTNFYFRDQPQFCDEGMKDVMGATALENQIGAILN